MSNSMFERALQLDLEEQGQGQQLGTSMFDRAMQIQAEEDAKAQKQRQNASQLTQEPQEERGFLDAGFAAAKAGAAGVIGGQADLLDTFTGVGGDVGDYMNDVAKSNARRKEYTIAEMLPFASDYWTNPEGAAYDVGSQFGSMVALGGEAAALSAGLSAAGIGGAGALASTAAAKAAQAGLPWLSKILSSKVGTAMVGNMLTTPFEAGSEAGSTGRTVKEEGGSEGEAQSAAAKNFAVQMGLLSMTNALESMGLGGMIAQAGGKKAFTRTLAGIFGNSLQQMYEEGSQTSADEFARGKQSIIDVFNPAGWSDDAWNAAGAGFTGGLVIGGGTAAAGRALNRNNFGEQPVDDAMTEGQNAADAEPQGEAQPETPATGNLVDKVRALEGQIAYEAPDGTNCMRTMGLALAGTPYEGQINVDQAVETAQQNNQLMDPADYTPKAGDLAVVEDGNHIVMVTENGGTIQNGASHNGVYESDQSANDMFGKVKYYIRTSDYNNGATDADAGNRRNTGDYKAARDYLKSMQEEMEAGDDYNAISNALDNGSRDDVIAEAIKRGFGQEQQPTAQQGEQQQPEAPQTPADVTVEGAADNVRATTEQVMQNGGKPTFNGGTAQEATQVTPVETPKADAAQPVITDDITPHAPQTKAEKQLADLQKKFRSIADKGEHLNIKLTQERIDELNEAAQTSDPAHVIEMARRFKLKVGNDLREYAKQRKQQPVKQPEAPQATEQFKPTAETTTVQQPTAQQPQTERLGEGEQMPVAPQNNYEQVRSEMLDAIGKLKPKMSKNGKRSVVSDALNKALRDGRINPKEMADLKAEGFAAIDNPQQSDAPKAKKDITRTTESVERVRSSVEKILDDVRAGKRKETAMKDIDNLLNRAREDRTISPEDYDDIHNGAKEEMRRVRQLEKSKVPADGEGLTKDSGKADNKGKKQTATAKESEGGEADGKTEERAGVGDLQRDDSGSGERPSVRESGQEENRNVQERPERPDELGDVQGSDGRVQLKHKKPKGADKVNALRKKLNLPALNFYVTDDREAFSKSLEKAKSDNIHGAYVDSQPVEKLKGCTLIMVEGANAGVAIDANGDIKGVHKGKASDPKYRGLVRYLILVARQNGGKKMDCFGKALVRMYNDAGFKAVSKTPFVAEFADPDPLLQSEKPEVFALMVTEDSTEQVIEKLLSDSQAYQTAEELDGLHTHTGKNGYEDALKERDDLLAKQEEANGKNSKTQQRKETDEGEPVQREKSESAAEKQSDQDNDQETDRVEEVNSWTQGTSNLFAADDAAGLDALFAAEASRQRRPRTQTAQQREDAELETAIRDVELTEEARQERTALDEVNAYIDSIGTPQKKTAAKGYFKKKPERKDFCAEVISKHPKVTVRERKTATKDNSEYFVLYDGLELPEKISKVEADVIAGAAKVQITKEAPKPKTEPKKPAKSKYIAEIPKDAAKGFLNKIASTNEKLAGEYKTELAKHDKNGMTWFKSIRLGVFKDLQNRGGLKDGEYYDNNLLRLSDSKAQDEFYEYLYDTYLPLVKKISRNTRVTDEQDIRLSEQEMLGEIKKVIGQNATDEDARRVLDYANAVYPGVNIDELETKDLKSIVEEAQTAREPEDRIERKTDEVFSEADAQAGIAEALAAIGKSTPSGQAMMVGINAENANFDQWERAVKMQAAGKSNAEMYDATGWAYGRDKKWRFYIADDLDLVDYGKLKNGHAKLGEVYPLEQLYKAYPWLRRIDVVVDEKLRGTKKLGGRDPKTNSIVLSPDLVAGRIFNPATKDPRTTLVHEIQHIIQGYEGHGEGGSPSTVRAAVQEKVDTYYDEAATVSPYYRGYYEARAEYQRLLEEETGNKAAIDRLDTIIRRFERDYIPNRRDRATIMRAMRKAERLTDILSRYNDEQLYDLLYGEREANRSEYAADDELRAKRAAEKGDTADAERAQRSARAEVLAEIDKNSPVFNPDVIVLYGTEKARAMQASIQQNKDELDNFDPNVMSQIIRVGYMRLQQGFDTASAWRNTLSRDFKDVLARVQPLLDSVWEFLRKLPRGVAAETKKMMQALNLAGRAVMSNIKPATFKKRLQEAMPQVYEDIKDFLDPAFAAIRHYPRKNRESVVKLNQENKGGDRNEHVRVAGTDAESSGSRGTGERLENGVRTADSGSQSQSETENSERLHGNLRERPDVSDSGSSVRRSGTALSGTQSNQQGSQENAANSQRGTGSADAGRSGRADEARNAGSAGRMGVGSETRPSQKAGDVLRQHGDSSGVGGTLSNQRPLTTENIPIEAGNAENVRRTLPLLFKEQQDDVIKTERRMFKDNGKGMLIANGTGTGKTLTGLGVVKRFLMQGKKNILIVVPTSDIANNWINEGKRIGIDGMETITTNKFSPDDINVITYASLFQNESLTNNNWDLIVCDESHNLATGQQSTEESPSNAVKALRGIIGHDRGLDGWVMLRHLKTLRNAVKAEELAVKARAELMNAFQMGKVTPELREQAAKANETNLRFKEHVRRIYAEETPLYEKHQKETKDSSKVLMLSATPFAYSGDIYTAEGILFNYSDFGTDYRGFMVDRMGYDVTKTDKLKMPKTNTANEVAFHDMLTNNGAMTNRRLVVDKDYNRKFVQVKADIGDQIDKGFDVLSDARNGYTLSGFSEYMNKRFDYQTKKRILEAAKAEASVPMIKEYIKQGKKVVLFHDTKIDTPLLHPFKIGKDELAKMNPELQEEYKRFSKEHPELLELDFGQLKPVVEVMKGAFGNDVLTINGSVSKSKKAEAVRIFNDDNYINENRDDSTDGKLIVITVDAGKEGISLHDTSGKYQRVLINLGMPTKPTDAIQLEGRIYRVGQASNAMFRYLATGTKMEKRAFMERVANRSRSAENMALGSEARELDSAFADGFLGAMDSNAKFDVTKDTEDSGGKLSDARDKAEMYKSMQSRKIDDEYLQAKINEMVEDYKTERDEKARQRILTPENERAFVAQTKKAFNAKGVTKVADGIYVVDLPIPRKVWINLNTAQAEVLGDMSDAEKQRLKSAADVHTSGFEIQGFYEQNYLKGAEEGKKVDIIHLTEAAKGGTLYHEMFHFVHNVILNTPQKQYLAEYYLHKLRKDIGDQAFMQMTPTERLNRVYEMEAEDYRKFAEHLDKPKNMLESIMNKMREWLARFADAMGIHTPYGLYLQVRSGKIYTRGVDRNTLRKKAEQAATETAQAAAVPTGVQITERPDGTRLYSIAEDGSIDGKRTKDDIAATLAAANEHAIKKAAVEEDTSSGVVVKKREKTELEKKGEAPMRLFELGMSPSRIAEKYPIFKSFYTIYRKAQDTQEKLRNRWNKNFNNALGNLKTQEDMEQFLDLQVSGEYEQKEYTIKELREQGYSESVIKAYTQTRQLIRNIWTAVNDAHRGLKTYTDKVNSKELRELKNDKFVENLVVMDPVSKKFVPANQFTAVPGPEYEVRYQKGKVYRSSSPEAMSEQQVAELRQSPYAKIVGTPKLQTFAGGELKYYDVMVERVTPPIGKITGYLPHMFEQWMVMVETDEGMRPIGSGRTLKEAYKEANKYQQANPKLKIYVEPKVFDPNTFMGDGEEASGAKFTGSDAVVVSDADYIKLYKALVDNNRMSVAEAKAALEGAVKRSSRNRFFGALRQRKGRTGYNTDIIGTLGRYITQSSRYCAMQPAKSTAIPLYERTFRKSYEAKTTSDMEELIQDYIRYNNGTPTKWEKSINDWLNSLTWWSEHMQATYGDRAALALTNKVNSQVSKAKLGFLNVSSAIVNMSQLMNTIGLIGVDATGKGIKAMQRMNVRDKRILIETGVTGNIAMDTAGGFTGNRSIGSDWRKKKAATPLGKFFQAYNDIADKSMVLFKKTDTITRTITTLGAYYEGIDKGMTHKQAIAYARDINTKANFDYGAADAPGIFRRTSGTIIGELALMFRKYPIKELEMMAEMAPWSNRSTKAQKARFWGTYFLMAGLLGFPGADYLDELLETLLGYKPSVLAKAWIFKNLGDNPLTRAIVYGVGGAAGVDVSRRVGLADVVPNEASIWANLSGPTGSTLAQLASAAARQDGTAAVKAWSPAMGHMLDAVNGYRVNSRGQIAAKYEGLERVLKAAGFRPVKESITSDMQSAMYAERDRYKNERAALLREMAEKQLDGKRLTNEDMKKLRELNITGRQLNDAIRKMEMTNDERIRVSMTRRDREMLEGTPLAD